MNKELKTLFEDNKNSWNLRTDIHVESSFYNLDEFKKNQDSLNTIETEILDELSFSKGIHVQCHFGMDTISLAKKYGVPFTGVDFSPKAVEFARALSSELGSSTSFIESNILELNQNTEETFDLAFASYGTIGWFPDLNDWMNQVARRLEKGGHFLLCEFHPVMWMYNEALTEVEYSYFNKHIITEDTKGTYTDGGEDIPHRDHTWNHPLDEVIHAAQANGLRFKALKEYDYTPYNIWPPMYKSGEGWRNDSMKDKLPYVYSLLCVKE